MTIKTQSKEYDYFNDPIKRQELFERDKWKCDYCGEEVTKDNATLDHLIPQSKGGKNTKDNLKTSCLLCNSIKSGKTYEEAAHHLLKSISERKKRT
ncbi:MAG TPA: HNH endonuclease [Candidatus Nanoarchaeia archaeon]|nr:HNH endonuclease [Candidatus Nanoarchaeia archaeon]